jgi:hypothetical protein
VLLLGLELFTADFFQREEIGLRQFPYNGRGDAFIVVAQDVSDATLPRECADAELSIHLEGGGFRNYLDSAFDEPLPLPVSLEDVQLHFPITLRMRSMASMMSARRAIRERRAVTRTRGQLSIQSADAALCAGCHAS